MTEQLEPGRREVEPGPWEAALRRMLDDGRRHAVGELRVLAVPEWLLSRLARERHVPLSVAYMAGWAVDMVLVLDLGDVTVRTGWFPPRDGVESITAHASLCSAPVDSGWSCHRDVAPDQWSYLTADDRAAHRELAREWQEN